MNLPNRLARIQNVPYAKSAKVAKGLTRGSTISLRPLRPLREACLV
jgi:hypothetical protein